MSIDPIAEIDVLVVGGSAAGCSAAIAAAREGSKVIVLEPTASIGGITANGVHCFDTGSLPALSGIAEEFVGRVLEHYAALGLDHPMLHSKSDVFWEFHIAEKIWRDMIAEFDGIRFINGAVPMSVVMDGQRIAEVHWEPAVDALGNPSGQPRESVNRIRPRVVIDATHEGDVAAWAGASFELGREARSPEEPHAGVMLTTTHERHIDRNGYLPSTILPGSTGEGDDAIMAFTYRLSLKYRSEGFEPHILPEKPDRYDPSRYSWAYQGSLESEAPAFGSELIPTMGGKVLTNQRLRGDDRLTGTRDFILAHPRQRTEIRKAFIDHVLGFLYFIQHEGGMPQIGLADDEYVGNGNRPHILYVREGRRFHGAERMTETDVSRYLASPSPRPPRRADAIAIGDWAIESRRCRDEVDAATGSYDGALFPRALRAPYQVPFGCLVPRGVDNLLVTTTISATHIAFCALRVEALWTQTGAAAGLAAHLASRSGAPVSETSIEAVQSGMLREKFKLTYLADVETSHPDFIGIQWLALRGFVPDDANYRFFPERSATFGELARAAVLAFGLPVSVTGFHFDGLEPAHPSFRDVETLYDLASRAGVELFAGMRNPPRDAPAEYLRPEPRMRWLSFETDDTVRTDEAIAFLNLVAEAAGSPVRLPAPDRPARHAISRGALASLAMRAASDPQIASKHASRAA